MKHLPKLTVFGSLALLLLVLFTSCATRAGQVSANEVWPSLDIVTTRQREYLATGLLPDGRPIPPAILRLQRNTITACRNVILAALGQPLEPLLSEDEPVAAAAGGES